MASLLLATNLFPVHKLRWLILAANIRAVRAGHIGLVIQSNGYVAWDLEYRMK